MSSGRVEYTPHINGR